MWNSCRNEMPWQNPLTKNPKKIAPLSQNGGERCGGLVGRQSKVNLLHVRANVLATVCP